MSRDPLDPDSPPRAADAPAQDALAQADPAPARRPDRQAAPAPSGRDARMAEALRANLQRRKAQARARAADAGDPQDGTPGDAAARGAPAPDPAPDN